MALPGFSPISMGYVFFPISLAKFLNYNVLYSYFYALSSALYPREISLTHVSKSYIFYLDLSPVLIRILPEDPLKVFLF